MGLNHAGNPRLDRLILDDLDLGARAFLGVPSLGRRLLLGFFILRVFRGFVIALGLDKFLGRFPFHADQLLLSILVLLIFEIDFAIRSVFHFEVTVHEHVAILAAILEIHLLQLLACQRPGELVLTAVHGRGF